MIPIPELIIGNLFEIHPHSAYSFLKKNIDPVKCLPGQLEKYHQQINKLKSLDEQEKFIYKNFSLYARTLFNIEDEIRNFDFGLAAIRDKTSGKWGFVDVEYNLVIPCNFDEVEDFNGFGHATVRLKGRWGMINKKNKFFLFEHKQIKECLFLPYDI